jgi:dCMP deaminase
VRPTKDETLLRIAWAMSEQGTCSRLQVGAVIAQDTRICSTGWNGAPAGLGHCDHDGSETRCTTSVHAEMNAIGYAARQGLTTGGATLYVTHTPCEHCAPVVIAAGIVRVVYAKQYGSGAGALRLLDAGVKVEQLADSWPIVA